MRHTKAITISVMIIAVLIVGMILWPRFSGTSELEPRFQALTAGEWVVRRCKNPDDTEAKRALRELGPNAAPALIQAVLISSSPLDRTYSKVYWNTPAKLREALPFVDAKSIQNRAYDDLKLVTHGRRPVPKLQSEQVISALIESLACKDERSIHGWYERVNGERRPLKVGTEIKLFAVDVLGLLGAQAQSALPALRELSSTTDERIANRTRTAIERIESDMRDKENRGDARGSFLSVRRFARSGHPVPSFNAESSLVLSRTVRPQRSTCSSPERCPDELRSKFVAP